GLAAPGIDAVAIGPRDCALGRERVLGLVATHGLPALAANLVCGDGAPLPGARVVERGGRRIAVVGLTSGEVDGCGVGPARASAEAALGALGPVDVAVALVPDPAAIPALDGLVDVVVDGGSGRILAAPRAEGSAWVVSAGSRGKQLGVATL